MAGKNKVTRLNPLVQVGAVDPPETTTKSDHALEPGWSINGAPPLVASGDALLSVARVLCHGNPVAVLWQIDSRARSGRPPFVYLEAQLVTDADARPPVVRTVENLVTPRSRHAVDCLTCGRRHVEGARLIPLWRKGIQRIAGGSSRTVEYHLPRK